MAIKGLSKPYYAKYTNNAGVVSYSDGGVFGKAIDWGVRIQKSDDNHLYADNNIAETDKGKFQSGELSVTTSGIAPDTSRVILGIKTKTVTVNGKSATVSVYDDDAESPDLGFGIIECHQNNNIDKYRAVILLRTYFNIPEDAATTKGENVEWGTPAIAASIMRSEAVSVNGNHPWKEEAWFDTEADAETYIKEFLGIVAKSAPVTSSVASGTYNTAQNVTLHHLRRQEQSTTPMMAQFHPMTTAMNIWALSSLQIRRIPASRLFALRTARTIPTSLNSTSR